MFKLYPYWFGINLTFPKSNYNNIDITNSNNFADNFIEIWLIICTIIILGFLLFYIICKIKDN